MSSNFSYMKKNFNPWFKQGEHKGMPGYIIIKLLETSDNEKSYKSSKENAFTCGEEVKYNFGPLHTLQARRHRMTSSKC